MTAGHHHDIIQEPRRRAIVLLAAVLMMSAVHGLSAAAAFSDRAKTANSAAGAAADPVDQPAEHFPTSTSDARDQLARILEQPLYQRWKLRHRPIDEATLERSDPGWLEPLQKWLSELAEAVGTWLDRWFGGSESRGRVWLPSARGGLGPALELVGWMALGVVVLFLAVIAYQTLRNARTGGAGVRVLSRAQLDAALEAGAALALASPQWLIEADRLARAGDYRAMYRALYLALLSGLHRCGKIDFRKTRTNWAYVARYRGPTPDRDRFALLTAGFDTAWYGNKTPPLSDIERVRGEVVAMLGQEP